MLAPDFGFRPARGDWARAGLVAAALFMLYAATSPRTVATEDDGLFILSSYFLGIEHAPGYPLFTLAGKLFTLLPIGSVAYRVHLASALFGGLACGAAWLCARALTGARLPAYVAAFALGCAPVYWSQAIIAEVYTLNVLFFLVLVFLALQAHAGRDVLPWMALVFGLSLSNHWPLMGLVAPGFLIALWPRLPEMARRLPLLAVLFLVGLLPYAWMVWRSWQEPPISYVGALETWSEVWRVVSRATYAEVDERLSASWLDRLRYLPFLGWEFLYHFAFVGAALSALGCIAQWRAWGRRVSAFLLVAFLMPGAGLVLLLKFDYDTIQKHIFHVYPLPSYAVGALWCALGFAWLADRYAASRRAAHAAAAALVVLLLAWGARTNLQADFDWTARYAQTILRTLPRDAAVFVQGDADLAPIAYFHMIENWRPDITLYQPQGLMLGNRRFHPLRVDKQTMERVQRDLIEGQQGPVVFTLDGYSRYARTDRWLFIVLDKSSPDATRITVDVPEEAVRFFEESVAPHYEPNGWLAYFQGELRRRYALLLAYRLQQAGTAADARTLRQLDVLSGDFYGALGLAEGLMSSQATLPAGAVVDLLEKARLAMPPDVPKLRLSRYFHLRGVLRLRLKDRDGAVSDFETALLAWPVPENPALEPLRDLYRQAGDNAALAAIEARVHQPRH
jgi:hypothetical protein